MISKTAAGFILVSTILALSIGSAVAANQTIVKENPITSQVNNRYIISVVFKNISAASQDEYIILYNDGDDAPNLLDWTVTADNKTTFKLPSFILLPLESVKIHFGRGTTNSTDLYLNQSANILNDQRGDIKLGDFTGALISEAKY